MKITKRDIEIMKFINDCGFCITPHLARRFGIKNYRVYKLMKRLVEDGLVRQVQIFCGEPNIYYLTNRGGSFSDLPIISGINLGIYEHQVTLINVVIRLRELYPLSTLVSERQLKQENFFEGIGVRGHVSDGVLIHAEDNQIAIEVELTMKSKGRLEKILRSYMAQSKLKEVWYFCAPNVIDPLTKVVAKKSFIKILSVEEFLCDFPR